MTVIGVKGHLIGQSKTQLNPHSNSESWCEVEIQILPVLHVGCCTNPPMDITP